MKLKTNLSFIAMSKLFQTISESTCRRIFYFTLTKLATIIESTLEWVPKEEIERNMSLCFTKFRGVTCVLDCTEIHIQAPKSVRCRLKFYSQYKSDFTIKFMVDVTPAGLIHFLSPAFGGRASDKAIFNYTEVIKNFEETRDSVMVDKGFLIEDECVLNRIKLIRPPFLRKKRQLSEKDAMLNRNVAAARIDIERMNARIKVMEIVNGKLEWHLLDHPNDIFLLYCGLANLGTPILATDKFML